MISKWTSHLKTDKEKEDFAKEVQGSKRVLDRLKEMVTEQEQELNQVEITAKTYEIPNWDYRQAHNNGYRQCLYLIKRIVDLDSTKSHPDQRILRPND